MNKPLLTFAVLAFIFTTATGHAQTPESVVSVEAGAAGLSLATNLSIGGTYWLVMPGANSMAPMPCPPLGLNLPIYLAVPTQRDLVWIADITYVPTAEGWLYVAGVLDRCTRRCLGWAMGNSLATMLPLAALDMALQQRRPPAGLVHHSDRGVQYASEAYRQKLAVAGVIPSMSRPGNCYDNAAMESFWSSLKRELVHRCRFASHAEAQAAIFEWIEVFYNRERLHSTLGFKSPVDFESQLN